MASPIILQSGKYNQLRNGILNVDNIQRFSVSGNLSIGTTLTTDSVVIGNTPAGIEIRGNQINILTSESTYGPVTTSNGLSITGSTVGTIEILVVDGNPHGNVTAASGSIAIRNDSPSLYQNTGGTSWTLVGSGGGGGSLDDAINFATPDNDVVIPSTDPLVFRDGGAGSFNLLSLERTSASPGNVLDISLGGSTPGHAIRISTPSLELGIRPNFIEYTGGWADPLVIAATQAIDDENGASIVIQTANGGDTNITHAGGGGDLILSAGIGGDGVPSVGDGGRGGAINLFAGFGGSGGGFGGTGGEGGAINVYAGDGGDGEIGGALNLYAGNSGLPFSLPTKGGSVNIFGGEGVVAAAGPARHGGDVFISGGFSSSGGNGGNGGSVFIRGGGGQATHGTIYFDSLDSGDIAFNEVGDEVLDPGFTAVSVIGAINELFTSGGGGGGSLDDAINFATPDNDVIIPLTDPLVFRDGGDGGFDLLTLSRTTTDDGHSLVIDVQTNVAGHGIVINENRGSALGDSISISKSDGHPSSALIRLVSSGGGSSTPIIIDTSTSGSGSLISMFGLNSNIVVTDERLSVDSYYSLETAGDLTFQALGSSDIPLNESGDEDLDAGFTAVSIIGAINELFASGGGGGDDHFAYNIIVGNVPAGDPSVAATGAFRYIPDVGDGAGIALALTEAGLSSTPISIFIRAGDYSISTPLVIPSNTSVYGSGTMSTILNCTGSNRRVVTVGQYSSLRNVGVWAPVGASMGASGTELILLSYYSVLRDVYIYYDLYVPANESLTAFIRTGAGALGGHYPEIKSVYIEGDWSTTGNIYSLYIDSDNVSAEYDVIGVHKALFVSGSSERASVKVSGRCYNVGEIEGFNGNYDMQFDTFPGYVAGPSLVVDGARSHIKAILENFDVVGTSVGISVGQFAEDISIQAVVDTYHTGMQIDGNRIKVMNSGIQASNTSINLQANSNNCIVIGNTMAGSFSDSGTGNEVANNINV